MTNEEKLKKLLRVASENGWTADYISYNIINNIYDNFSVRTDFIIGRTFLPDNPTPVKDFLSLNDLVCNWEEGEVSFIEALCKASKSLSNSHYNNWINNLYVNINFRFLHQQVEFLWEWEVDIDGKIDKKPSSQKLDWLFETFKHLL